MSEEWTPPDEIWLLRGLGDGGSDIWCEDPDPDGHEPENAGYLLRTPERAAAGDLADAARRVLTEWRAERGHTTFALVDALEALEAALAKAGRKAGDDA